MTESTDLDTLKEWLHALHGVRMCMSSQHLSDADVRKAALTQGQMEGVRMAIMAIEQIQDGEGPDVTGEQRYYNELSKQRFKVQKHARKETDEKELRGLE